MAARREIKPMPDCGIFADTQWEPKAVYDWLAWLENQLPFPIYRVTAGNLRAALLSGENSTRQRFAAVPWFMDEGRAMGRRQCTKEYKIRPIQRKIVELLGGRPKGGAILWIGISTDEAARMRPSKVQYIVHRWPLIEKGMSRNDCLRWMGRNNFPVPPKSSCIGCPYHSDHQWREIKQRPEEWAQAVEVDQAIRYQPKFKKEQFMHRSCRPIDEVDFSTDEDRGQLNMFNNECDGMCGV